MNIHCLVVGRRGWQVTGGVQCKRIVSRVNMAAKCIGWWNAAPSKGRETRWILGTKFIGVRYYYYHDYYLSSVRDWSSVPACQVRIRERIPAITAPGEIRCVGEFFNELIVICFLPFFLWPSIGKGIIRRVKLCWIFGVDLHLCFAVIRWDGNALNPE